MAHCEFVTCVRHNCSICTMHGARKASCSLPAAHCACAMSTTGRLSVLACVAMQASIAIAIGGCQGGGVSVVTFQGVRVSALSANVLRIEPRGPRGFEDDSSRPGGLSARRDAISGPSCTQLRAAAHRDAGSGRARGMARTRRHLLRRQSQRARGRRAAQHGRLQRHAHLAPFKPISTPYRSRCGRGERQLAGGRELRGERRRRQATVVLHRPQWSVQDHSGLCRTSPTPQRRCAGTPWPGAVPRTVFQAYQTIRPPDHAAARAARAPWRRTGRPAPAQAQA